MPGASFARPFLVFLLVPQNCGCQDRLNELGDSSRAVACVMHLPALMLVMFCASHPALSLHSSRGPCLRGPHPETGIPGTSVCGKRARFAASETTYCRRIRGLPITTLTVDRGGPFAGHARSAPLECNFNAVRCFQKRLWLNSETLKLQSVILIFFIRRTCFAIF